MRKTGCLEVILARKVAHPRVVRVSFPLRAHAFLSLRTLSRVRYIFLPHPLSRLNLSIVGFRSLASLVNWFLSRSLMSRCRTNVVRSRSDDQYWLYNNHYIPEFAVYRVSAFTKVYVYVNTIMENIACLMASMWYLDCLREKYKDHNYGLWVIVNSRLSKAANDKIHICYKMEKLENTKMNTKTGIISIDGSKLILRYLEKNNKLINLLN